jgi:uncharacterized membrane protein
MAASASAPSTLAADAPTREPPAWAAPVSLLLCLAGLALSAYLTVDHYSSATVLSCPDTGVVNCARVTSSPQAMLFGFLPVALAGLLFFVAMTLLCTPRAWHSGTPALRWARVAGVVAGVAMVCYLVYVEFHVLGALCLWCTAVHGVTFVLFVVVLAADALSVTRVPAETESS